MEADAELVAIDKATADVSKGGTLEGASSTPVAFLQTTRLRSTSPAQSYGSVGGHAKKGGDSALSALPEKSGSPVSSVGSSRALGRVGSDDNLLDRNTPSPLIARLQSQGSSASRGGSPDVLTPDVVEQLSAELGVKQEAVTETDSASTRRLKLLKTKIKVAQSLGAFSKKKKGPRIIHVEEDDDEKNPAVTYDLTPTVPLHPLSIAMQSHNNRKTRARPHVVPNPDFTVKPSAKRATPARLASVENRQKLATSHTNPSQHSRSIELNDKVVGPRSQRALREKENAVKKTETKSVMVRPSTAGGRLKPSLGVSSKRHAEATVRASKSTMSESHVDILSSVQKSNAALFDNRNDWAKPNMKGRSSYSVDDPRAYGDRFGVVGENPALSVIEGLNGTIGLSEQPSLEETSRILRPQSERGASPIRGQLDAVSASLDVTLSAVGGSKKAIPAHEELNKQLVVMSVPKHDTVMYNDHGMEEVEVDLTCLSPLDLVEKAYEGIADVRAKRHFEDPELFIDYIKRRPESLEYINLLHVPNRGPMARRVTRSNYSLKIVTYDEVYDVSPNNFFTMSARGITHYLDGKQNDFSTLEGWLFEREVYSVLIRRKTFMGFRLFKYFNAWKKVIHNGVFSIIQAHLKRHMLPFLSDSIRDVMYTIRILILDHIEKFTLIDPAYETECYELSIFLDVQRTHMKKSVKEVQEFVYTVQDLALTAINNVSEEMSHCAYKMELSALEEEYFRRLTRFARLVDQYAVDAIVETMVESLTTLTNRILCRGDELTFKKMKNSRMSMKMVRGIDFASKDQEKKRVPERVTEENKKNALFFIGLAMIDKELRMLPTLKDFENMISSCADAMIETLSLDRVLSDERFKSFISRYLTSVERREKEKGAQPMDIGSRLRLDPFTLSSRENCVAAIRQSYSEARVCMEPFAMYVEMYNDPSKRIDHTKFGVDSIGEIVDVDFYRHALNSLTEYGGELLDLSEPRLSGCFVTKPGEVANELREELVSKPMRFITENVSKNLLYLSDNLYNDMVHAHDLVSTVPTSLASCANWLEYLSGINDKVSRFEDRITNLQDYRKILGDFEFAVYKLDEAKYDMTIQYIDKLKVEVEKAKESQATVTQSFQPNLNRNMEAMAAEMEEAWSLLQKNKSEAYIDVFDALNWIEKARESLEERSKRVKTMKNQCKLFGIKFPYYKVPELRHELNQHEMMWRAYSSFQRRKNAWLFMPAVRFPTFSGQEITKEMIATINTNYMVLNKVVTDPWRKECDEFNEICKIIRWLNSPDMQFRHWKLLWEGVSKRFIMDENTIAVNLFKRYKLADKGPIVEKVVNQAEQEAVLVSAINALEARWAQVKFTTAVSETDKTDIVLGNISEIVGLARDDLEVLKIIKASPFSSIVMSKVERWTNDLAAFQYIVLLWNRYETLRVEVFALMECRVFERSMHEAIRAFTNADRDYRSAMRTVREFPSAWKIVFRGHIKTTIEECINSANGLIEEAHTFHEIIRKAAPRLYFVSVATLINLMVKTKTVEDIKPIAREVFTGVDELLVADLPNLKRVRLERGYANAGRIVGMQSAEMERISFVKPVEVKGMLPNEWIAQIEKMMISTMGKLIDRSIQNAEVASEDHMDQWIFESPVQASQVGAKCRFDSKLRTALTSPNSEEAGEKLRRLWNETNVRIGTYCIYQKDIDATVAERNMIASMMIQMLQSRDLLNQIFDAEAYTLTTPEWMTYLSYSYSVEDKQLSINAVGNSVKYGYEYMGSSRRPLISPTTAKAQVSLFQGMCTNLVGCMSGPSGSGKLDTLNDLATLCGKYLIVMDADCTCTPATLNGFTAGALFGSYWICFNRINRFNNEALSFLAARWHLIYDAMLEGATDIHLTGKYCSLKDSSFGMFCIVESLANRDIDRFLLPFDTDNVGNNSYTNNDDNFIFNYDTQFSVSRRGELPSSIVSLCRPVAIAPPDIGVVIRTHMIINGMVEVDDWCPKLVMFFKMLRAELPMNANDRQYDIGFRTAHTIVEHAAMALREDPLLRERQALSACLCAYFVTSQRLLPEDRSIAEELIASIFGSPRGASTVMRGMSKDKVANPYREQIRHNIASTLPAMNLATMADQSVKITQLLDTIETRMATMVVGKPGSAKTTCIHAVSKLGEGDDHPVIRVVNASALRPEDLFGYYGCTDGIWRNGVIPRLIREISQVGNEWLLVDGCFDSSWLDRFESMVHNEYEIRLPTGERIKVAASMKIFFEGCTLDRVSPSLIPVTGLVHMGNHSNSWRLVVEGWLNFTNKSSSHKRRLHDLFGHFAYKCIKFVAEMIHTQKKLDGVVTIDSVDHVAIAQHVCRLMDVLFYRAPKSAVVSMSSKFKKLNVRRESINQENAAKFVANDWDWSGNPSGAVSLAPSTMQTPHWTPAGSPRGGFNSGAHASTFGGNAATIALESLSSSGDRSMIVVDNFFMFSLLHAFEYVVPTVNKKAFSDFVRGLASSIMGDLPENPSNLYDYYVDPFTGRLKPWSENSMYKTYMQQPVIDHENIFLPMVSQVPAAYLAEVHVRALTPFCLYGEPGCGKTSLMSRILDNVIPSEGFYTGYSEEDIENCLEYGFEVDMSWSRMSAASCYELRQMEDVMKKHFHRIAQQDGSYAVIPRRGSDAVVFVDDIEYAPQDAHKTQQILEFLRYHMEYKCQFIDMRNVGAEKSLMTTSGFSVECMSIPSMHMCIAYSPSSKCPESTVRFARLFSPVCLPSMDDDETMRHFFTVYIREHVCKASEPEEMVVDALGGFGRGLARFCRKMKSLLVSTKLKLPPSSVLPTFSFKNMVQVVRSLRAHSSTYLSTDLMNLGYAYSHEVKMVFLEGIPGSISGMMDIMVSCLVEDQTSVDAVKLTKRDQLAMMADEVIFSHLSFDEGSGRLDRKNQTVKLLDEDEASIMNQVNRYISLRKENPNLDIVSTKDLGTAAAQAFSSILKKRGSITDIFLETTQEDEMIEEKAARESILAAGSMDGAKAKSSATISLSKARRTSIVSKRKKRKKAASTFEAAAAALGSDFNKPREDRVSRIFEEAVKDLLKLVRVLSRPHSHVLLQGRVGTGRSSLVAVATMLMGGRMYEPALGRQQPDDLFRRELGYMFERVGLMGITAVLHISDIDSCSEYHLSRLVELLETGYINDVMQSYQTAVLSRPIPLSGNPEEDVPNELDDEVLKLYTDGAEPDPITDRGKAKCVHYFPGSFKQSIQDNVHVVICSREGMLSANRLSRYPVFMKTLVFLPLHEWPDSSLCQNNLSFLLDDPNQVLAKSMKARKLSDMRHRSMGSMGNVLDMDNDKSSDDGMHVDTPEMSLLPQFKMDTVIAVFMAMNSCVEHHMSNSNFHIPQDCIPTVLRQHLVTMTTWFSSNLVDELLGIQVELNDTQKQHERFTSIMESIGQDSSTLQLIDDEISAQEAKIEESLPRKNELTDRLFKSEQDLHSARQKKRKLGKEVEEIRASLSKEEHDHNEALEKVNGEMQDVGKGEAQETRRLTTESPVLRRFFEPICILLDIEFKWKIIVADVIDKVLDVKDRLLEFDMNTYHAEKMDALKPYMDDEHGEYAGGVIGGKSRFAAISCRFIKCVYEMQGFMQKKQEEEAKIMEREGEMDKLSREIKSIQDSMTTMDNELKTIVVENKFAQEEIQNLQTKRTETQSRAEKNKYIVAGARKLSTTLDTKIKGLQQSRENILGDMIFSAACITCLGQFSCSEKERITEEWKSILRSHNISISPMLSLIKRYWSKYETVQYEWVGSGLLWDNHYIECGILFSEAFEIRRASINRSIVIHDPWGTMEGFLRNWFRPEKAHADKDRTATFLTFDEIEEGNEMIEDALHRGLNIVLSEYSDRRHLLILERVLMIFHSPTLNKEGARLIVLMRGKTVSFTPVMFRFITLIDADLDNGGLIEISMRTLALGRGFDYDTLRKNVSDQLAWKVMEAHEKEKDILEMSGESMKGKEGKAKMSRILEMIGELVDLMETVSNLSQRLRKIHASPEGCSPILQTIGTLLRICVQDLPTYGRYYEFGTELVTKLVTATFPAFARDGKINTPLGEEQEFAHVQDWLNRKQSVVQMIPISLTSSPSVSLGDADVKAGVGWTRRPTKVSGVVSGAEVISIPEVPHLVLNSDISESGPWCAMRSDIIPIVKTNLIKAFYRNVSLGIYEGDRPAFGFMLMVRLQMDNGVLDETDRKIFFNADVTPVHGTNKREIQARLRMLRKSRAFKNISGGEDDASAWTSFCNSSFPEEAEWPGSWRVDNISDIHRLLPLRVLRPDRFEKAIQNYLDEVMGIPRGHLEMKNLQDYLPCTSRYTPISLITEQGHCALSAVRVALGDVNDELLSLARTQAAHFQMEYDKTMKGQQEILLREQMKKPPIPFEDKVNVLVNVHHTPVKLRIVECHHLIDFDVLKRNLAGYIYSGDWIVFMEVDRAPREVIEWVMEELHKHSVGEAVAVALPPPSRIGSPAISLSSGGPPKSADLAQPTMKAMMDEISTKPPRRSEEALQSETFSPPEMLPQPVDERSVSGKSKDFDKGKVKLASATEENFRAFFVFSSDRDAVDQCYWLESVRRLAASTNDENISPKPIRLIPTHDAVTSAASRALRNSLKLSVCSSGLQLSVVMAMNSRQKEKIIRKVLGDHDFERFRYVAYLMASFHGMIASRRVFNKGFTNSPPPNANFINRQALRLIGDTMKALGPNEDTMVKTHMEMSALIPKVREILLRVLYEPGTYNAVDLHCIRQYANLVLKEESLTPSKDNLLMQTGLVTPPSDLPFSQWAKFISDLPELVPDPILGLSSDAKKASEMYSSLHSISLMGWSILAPMLRSSNPTLGKGAEWLVQLDLIKEYLPTKVTSQFLNECLPAQRKVLSADSDISNPTTPRTPKTPKKTSPSPEGVKKSKISGLLRSSLTTLKSAHEEEAKNTFKLSTSEKNPRALDSKKSDGPNSVLALGDLVNLAALDKVALSKRSDPVQSFIIDEIRMFNRQMNVITKSLAVLESAIRDPSLLTDEISTFFKQLIVYKVVPKVWVVHCAADEHQYSLAIFLNNLRWRASQMQYYADKMASTGWISCINLAGLYRPRGFLYAVLLDWATKNKASVDHTSFKYTVISDAVSKGARDTSYGDGSIMVEGILSAGAMWNTKKRAMVPIPHQKKLEDFGVHGYGSAFPIMKFTPTIDNPIRSNTIPMPLYTSSVLTRSPVANRLDPHTLDTAEFLVTVNVPALCDSKDSDMVWNMAMPFFFCMPSIGSTERTQ